MAGSCLLYYITDRTAFAADEATRRRRLLEKIAEAAHAGVDYIQLREKDLPTRELEFLAREAVGIIREIRGWASSPNPLVPALLINSRTDIALAVGADGVHLRSDDVTAAEVARLWEKGCVGTAALGRPAAQCAGPLISISCHSAAEVMQSEADGANFAVFAPVFEKKDAPEVRAAGLIQLRAACKASIPVLALGGITLENAKSCLDAGAAGIAAIRLFQENNVVEIVGRLRQLRR